MSNRNQWRRQNTLKEANCQVIRYLPDHQVLLLNLDTNKQEVWFLNTHSASYTIKVNRGAYEFARENCI